MKEFEVTPKLYDLDKAADPIQRAVWARANLKAALRDARIKVAELRAALDTADSAVDETAEEN